MLRIYLETKCGIAVTINHAERVFEFRQRPQVVALTVNTATKYVLLTKPLALIPANINETLLNGDEPVSTLTQDFHTRLDNLLRTLVHAKPHFVRCIRPNEHLSFTEFDRSHVATQIRSLQVLETVHLMHSGFPHRMRFKAFNARYKALAQPMKNLKKTEAKAVEDCEFILDCYSRQWKALQHSSTKNNNKDWAHGRKHIFLSEGARQQLEWLRKTKRQKAALAIQTYWRRSKSKQKIPNHLELNHQKNVINNSLSMLWQHSSSIKSRPKPITGTPPPLDEHGSNNLDRCDFKTIQQTCSLFGLDLVII